MGDYTRLSMQERCNITTFLEMGLSVSTIAKRLGRHRSTLYRELARNQTKGCYRPGLAHQKSQQRRPRKALKLQTEKALYQYVYARLCAGWSPEQIVGRMRLEKKPFDVCQETIYRYIYHQGKTLYRYLPSQKPKRQKRRTRRPQRCRYGENRRINKRPEYIGERRHFGHWEGDLIEFSGTKKKTVTTLVERKSRLVSLFKNTTKISSDVMKKIKGHFTDNNHIPCKTITFDQGSEFADYSQIELSLHCKVYYCDARSPWQRGSNENMNGRLRRYLPRQFPIDALSQPILDQLAHKMNTLPRKCLGFRTPKELFLKYYPQPCRTKT